MSKVFAILALTAGIVLGGATSALAHQHVNPSGTCPADSADVPQGDPENPAGRTPGGRNNAGNVMANCPER
jgi:hypothetical protein